MKPFMVLAAFSSVIFYGFAPVQIDWKIACFVCQQLWSIFWSYAPTPEPETWYNAFWHVSQYVAANPGRSIAISRKHELMKLGYIITPKKQEQIDMENKNELASLRSEDPASYTGDRGTDSTHSR